MNELKEKLLKRIEIDENNCWIWTGGVTSGSYGAIWNDGKQKLAHRVAYELFVGDIPEGMVLDHLCRMKLCCNKNHLEPVQQAENVRRGNLTKLTWAKVREIRRLYAEGGTSYAKLGRKFGVSRHTIAQIINNKTWVEEVAA